MLNLLPEQQLQKITPFLWKDESCNSADKIIQKRLRSTHLGGGGKLQIIDNLRRLTPLNLDYIYPR